MSRKKALGKKIAHTLMAMSIVYSSGINIVVNQVYAGEKTENITGSSASFTETGANGNNYAMSGGVTDGEDASITGKITDSNVVANPIVITANGGHGGIDNGNSPTVMQGAIGGDAIAKVTVDESLSSITTGNITVNATGGSSGSAYQGVAGDAGAAAAYGLEVKHDLTITAADITVSAQTKYNDNSFGNKVDIEAAKHNGATATGLQVDSGTVNFTGGGIKVLASNEAPYTTIDELPAEKTKGSDGGDAKAYGIRVNGGEVTAKLTGNIVVDKINAGSGANIYGKVDAGKGPDGGNGGNVIAYGVYANGGIAHLELEDIIIDSSSGSMSNYVSAGKGGSGADVTAQEAEAGNGGKGGNAAFVGVHVADGGKADGSLGAIEFNVKTNVENYGGSGGSTINSIGGNGGAGGDVYAAGISNDGGTAQLTVASMDIDIKSGAGSSAGSIELTGSNLLTATGTVQATGGKGGEALAVGVDNRSGSSEVTVTGAIKLAATGGNGGGCGTVSGYAYVTDTEAQILANEKAGGEGGVATAVGLQNVDGSLTADVAKLEIQATGGIGSGGASTYGSINGIGANGGAAAAYGINVIGGLAESLTVAEITVEATGGSSRGTGSNAMHVINDDGAGLTGGKGGNGGNAYAYGVSNSGGSAVATVGTITAKATGGKGGDGGNVEKKYDAVAAGIGGDGGDGGNTYAYGVFGTGSSSHTAIAVDKISASATAGAAGSGAALGDGVATAGDDGVAGEEAKAYGVYAAGGAVIDLSAKNSGPIKINAKAADGTVTNEAYAVYADKGTVLFGSDAELNWDGSSGTDNTLVTGLNNGTLGFSGTSADRTVTGGKLQLTGSNAFRFTTDLANNKADSMTFDTIENNSSKQYIQIGYEEAFKDALSKEDIVTINGSATVLTVTNLNGQNLNNFTGQASRLDSPLERFKVTPTVDVVDNKVNITEIALAKENSPSETAMVASDAQMALGSMWRSEGNNLMKRMGELRSDKEAAKGGVWARYYRGELSADSAYDRNFSQDYTAFQGGIDKVQDYKGGKLYTGIAVNRIDSNAGYTAGSGDLSSTGVGLYASWLGSKGHYVDVIARGSKLANDFKLVDLSGNSAKADYDTWAYGISAEYGYRQNLNAGWFVEPQAELSLGRIGSADYTTSNGVTIKQDSVNSAVVRLGFLGGKEFTIGGRTSNAYVKASALHDFGGNGSAIGYYENSSLALQTGDLTGTWYEIGLGANLGIAKNSNLYFDALKTFNGNLRTDWQFNAGLRFTF
ncbi:autotransporter outer membrane beta-barrel domain-containing protein [Phascolarctobacterium faecium]|uniref:autotransporter outer membrane beta-barrel domain-containing protein n=1 Tax=Phascolarctobacterium faecium TaxID=33025 RepID=UPI001659C4D9|nr:autotransporter outer membrane beta-barrel domain-containing protein [Phascolarctobacterium faecium]QNP77042.1 autotransporter outer membrane beta-barrel domain-containing protein [Phascolarctobacterium faecium]